jgi:hypothetical protein
MHFRSIPGYNTSIRDEETLIYRIERRCGLLMRLYLSKQIKQKGSPAHEKDD